MIQSLKVPPEYIEQEKQEQLKEIERRTALYRPAANHRGEYPITPGKTIVVLIDDGIASGATVIAAARWIRSKYKPAQLIIAAPVASKQAIELVRKEGVADVVETVTTPSNFVSVSQFYKDFDQMTDDNVMEVLKKRRATVAS
jgi:predicted phosphoribosyltransferase